MTTREVVIVGAGFGGIGMARELVRRGVTDFELLERAGDVGGTWRANTYPGCQCDIPSNLYSFSFAPKPDWTHAYPEQPQILQYLRDCVDRFGVRPHLRLDCEVTDARWDDDAAVWQIETSQGPLRAHTLIAAPGLLSNPRVPARFEAFEGEVFHSAQWDHDTPLDGRRVGMVGTGASAIQIGPAIQPRVRSLTVFQRSAPWIIPHPDRAIPDAMKRLYARVPAVQRLARGAIYAAHETMAPGLTYFPRLMKGQEANARLLRRRQVKDPELLAKVTPDYEIGCKRILLSSDWYPMLAEPNVELVTDGIEDVRAHSIVTADGTEHELDALIMATGFDPVNIPLAQRLHGRDGRSLTDVWGGLAAGLPGHRGRRLSQPVHDLRPQPEPGAHVHGLPAGVADRLRGPGAGAAGAPGRDGGPARGPAALQRRPPAAAGAQRLEQRRLLVVVPGRERPQLDPVAGLLVLLP